MRGATGCVCLCVIRITRVMRESAALGWAQGSAGKMLFLRFKTMWALIQLFATRQRFFLIPLLLCLLLLGVLLLTAEVLPAFSPFVYAAF